MPGDFGASIWGPALLSFLGRAFDGGGNDSPTTTTEQRQLQQEMLRLINQQRGYMSQMDPLRESVLRMAMGMLPIRYQTGGVGAAQYGQPGSMDLQMPEGSHPRPPGAETVGQAVPRGSVPNQGYSPDYTGDRVDSATYRKAVNRYFEQYKQ